MSPLRRAFGLRFVTRAQHSPVLARCAFFRLQPFRCREFSGSLVHSLPRADVPPHCATVLLYRRLHFLAPPLMTALRFVRAVITPRYATALYRLL